MSSKAAWGGVVWGVSYRIQYITGGKSMVVELEVSGHSLPAIRKEIVEGVPVFSLLPPELQKETVF